MAKPVIGVMPLWDDEKDSIWMLPGYFDGIIREGGERYSGLLLRRRGRTDRSRSANNIT